MGKLSRLAIIGMALSGSVSVSHGQSVTDLHREATGILLQHISENDASIQAARQDRAINDEGIRRAESLNDATVTASGSGTLSYVDIDQNIGNAPVVNSNAKDHDLAASLGLSKNLYDWGRQDSQVRQAQLTRAASEHSIRQETESTYRLALQAYYSTARSIARIDVREQSLVNLRSKVDESEQRFEAGIGDSTTLAVAEASLALGISNLSQEQATYESVISELRRYAPEDFDRLIPDNIVFPKPHAKLYEITLDDALLAQEEFSPSLASSRDVIAIAEAQLETFEKVNKPNLGLRMSLNRTQGYGNTESANTSGSAVVNFSMPIITSGTVNSDIARQKQQISKARLQYRANRDRQQSLLKSAWNEFHALDQTLTALQKNVDARQTLLDRARQAQRVGQFTVSQVLDEEDKLLDAELLLIDSQFQQLSKGHEIINLIGWSLADYL